jgi:IS1 family transposase
VKHLEDCVFYTDNWDAFVAVLPPERHIVGKAHTSAIERDNSNTRHHIGRFTRRSKVVSKKSDMVDLTLKLWQTLTDEIYFRKYQAVAIYL